MHSGCIKSEGTIQVIRHAQRRVFGVWGGGGGYIKAIEFKYNH